MSSEKKSFGKKVDKLVFYILIPCIAVSVIPMFWGGEAFWILLLVNSVSWGLIYWLYQTTDTTIQGDLLIHTVGPITWEISIADIIELRSKSNSAINHGTWSMDKMDVVYTENYKKTLSIAPLLKEELINNLVSLNPEIKLS